MNPTLLAPVVLTVPGHETLHVSQWRRAAGLRRRSAQPVG
jgi:hypothetical protein